MGCCRYVRAQLAGLEGRADCHVYYYVLGVQRGRHLREEEGEREEGLGWGE